MGLKFMQRAEEKEKALLKENADRLIKLLEEDAESDEEPKEFLSSAKKFGKAKTLTDDQIMKATQKMLKTEKEPKKKETVKVTFDAKEDLKNFNKKSKNIAQVEEKVKQKLQKVESSEEEDESDQSEIEQDRVIQAEDDKEALE